MGPSVKFILPIIDAFPDKKMGVIFGAAKKDTTGGGGGGGRGGVGLGGGARGGGWGWGCWK